MLSPAPMMIATTDGRVVSDGTFLLDGGTMFGVIPKALWARVHLPDESNRIRLGLNCVLFRARCGHVLIEGGIGRAFSAREAEIYSVEGNSLTDGLEAEGIGTDDIRYVVLSHLHLDHAGATLAPDARGRPEPLFRRAAYIVQRREWEDAMVNYGVMRNSYRSAALRSIEEHGNLRLIEGEFELSPEVKLLPTGGHTRGHQAVVLTAGEDKIIFPGDLIPTASHVASTWISSYDLFPVDTMKAKRRLLSEAAAERALIVFYHEPGEPVRRIVETDDGRIAAEKIGG